jgi:hypothetical protein
VAVLRPARVRCRRRKKGITQENIDAALSAFGAWKNTIDPEGFKRQIPDKGRT